MFGIFVDIARSNKVEMKWFASHSEEDIIAKQHNVVASNTLKANKAAANLFRSYLKETVTSALKMQKIWRAKWNYGKRWN